MDLEPINLPPVPRRANREELVDWRTWIDYSAEWENFETPVAASSFAKNRRIGKRHEVASGLTDESSEEDAVEERRKALSDEFVQDSSSEGESQEVEYDDGSDGLNAGSNGRESRGNSGEEMGDSMHASSPELGGQPSIKGGMQDEDEDDSGDENDDE